MSQPKTSKREQTTRRMRTARAVNVIQTSTRNRLVALTVGALVVIMGVTLVLASWAAPFSKHSPRAIAPAAPAAAPLPATALSKEYIYAGGRLVATEQPVPVNSPPSINISGPAAGSVFVAPATIAIAASAADSDGTVSKVDFYQGTALIGTAVAAPFAFNWNNVAAGNYSLTAKATDDRGAITTSSAVDVTVNSPAPTVSITSPGSGTIFGAPANVAITASASVSAGTISKIDFYQGTILIGTATAAPFTFNWNSVGSGIYSLTAKATASTGTSAISAAVGVTVNNSPSVNLTAPTAGSVFVAPASIAINANAADSDGTISKVDFYQGTSLIGTVTTAPFNFNWSNVGAGSYTLTAKATDDRGAATTSTPVAVTVNSPVPTVSITSPANGAIFAAPASVVISANASVAAGTITRVDFYKGTTLIGTVTGAPYNFNWNNVAAGVYSLTAKATASTGTIGTSGAVSVTVNSPPSVSITAPAPGSVFVAPANIAISASAADSDGTVSKVEFYQGTTLIGTATASPFNFNWTNVAGGSYTLTAKATDDKGGTTTSTAVGVTVNNPAPIVSITLPANGMIFSAPANIAINATASVAAGTISKVDFYKGATLIGTVTTAPFTFNWSNVGPGVYSLTAKATASTGTNATSAAVNVTVDSPPSVSITSPANNSTFGPPISINVNVSAADSDGTVSKVEFFDGQTKVGESVSAPFSFSWNVVPAGNHSLTAKATDNLGTSTTSSAVAVVVSPAASGKIVFNSTRSGNDEIYTMSRDGSNVVRLTNNSAADNYPRFSPDGNKMLFASDRDGNSEIYVMNADGTNQTRLTNNPAFDNYPCWSPNGAKIVFASDRDGNREIYVMNADGSGQSRLTNNSAVDSQATWSPDGSRLVFQSNRDGGLMELYVMNADGSAQTRLTNNPATDSQPSWSPDGSKILFISDRDGNNEVYVMNANGTGQINLTHNPASDSSVASWSPDGALILFTSTRDGNEEVYQMNADGSGQARLTDNAAIDRYASWQPAPPPQAVVVVRDSFTAINGQELSVHVGEQGAAWAQPSYANSSKDYIFSNRVTHESVSLRNIYYASGQPQSDCYVQATITKLGDSSSANAGLVLRLNPSSANYYYVNYDGRAGTWAIYSNRNGSETKLGSWDEALATGDARTVKFQAIGNSLTLFINGISRIVVSNSDHSSAGRVGIVMSGSTSPVAGFGVSGFEAGTIGVMASSVGERTMETAQTLFMVLKSFFWI